MKPQTLREWLNARSKIPSAHERIKAIHMATPCACPKPLPPRDLLPPCLVEEAVIAGWNAAVDDVFDQATLGHSKRTPQQRIEAIHEATTCACPRPLPEDRHPCLVDQAIADGWNAAWDDMLEGADVTAALTGSRSINPHRIG